MARSQRNSEPLPTSHLGVGELSRWTSSACRPERNGLHFARTVPWTMSSWLISSENTSPLAVDDCAAPVTCFIPNDPGFPKQWHLQNNSQTVAPPGVTLKEDADVDAPRVWPTTKGSGGIAVLDDGLDLSHPDLLRSRGSVYDGTGENTIQSYGG